MEPCVSDELGAATFKLGCGHILAVHMAISELVAISGADPKTAWRCAAKDPTTGAAVNCARAAIGNAASALPDQLDENSRPFCEGPVRGFAAKLRLCAVAHAEGDRVRFNASETCSSAAPRTERLGQEQEACPIRSVHARRLA